MAASNPLVLVPTFTFTETEDIGDMDSATWPNHRLRRTSAVEVAILGKNATVTGGLRLLIDQLTQETEAKLAKLPAELTTEEVVYDTNPAAPLLAARHELIAAEQVFSGTSEYRDRTSAVINGLGKALTYSYQLVTPWEQRALRRQATELLYSRQFRARDMEINKPLLTEMLEYHPGFANSPAEFTEDWLTGIAIHHALYGDPVDAHRIPIGQDSLFMGLQVLFDEEVEGQNQRKEALEQFDTYWQQYDEYWEQNERTAKDSPEQLTGTARFGSKTAEAITFELPHDLVRVLNRAIGLSPYYWPQPELPSWPIAEPWDDTLWNKKIPSEWQRAWTSELGVILSEEADEIVGVTAKTRIEEEPTTEEPTSKRARRAAYKSRLAANRHPGPVSEPGVVDPSAGEIPLLLPLSPQLFGTFTDVIPSAPTLPPNGEHWERALRLTSGAGTDEDVAGEALPAAITRAAANIEDFRQYLQSPLPFYVIPVTSGDPSSTLKTSIRKASFDLRVLDCATLREDKNFITWIMACKEALDNAENDDQQGALNSILENAADSYLHLSNAQYQLADERHLSVRAVLTEKLSEYQDKENFPAIVRANGRLINQVISTSLKRLPSDLARKQTTKELQALFAVLEKAGCDVSNYLLTAQTKQKQHTTTLPPLISSAGRFHLGVTTPLLLPVSPDTVAAIVAAQEPQEAPGINELAANPAWETAQRLTTANATSSDLIGMAWVRAALLAVEHPYALPPIMESSSPVYQIVCEGNDPVNALTQALVKVEFDMDLMQRLTPTSTDTFKLSKLAKKGHHSNSSDPETMLDPILHFAALCYDKLRNHPYPVPGEATRSLRKVVTQALKPWQESEDFGKILDANGYLLNMIATQTMIGLNKSPRKEAAEEMLELLDLAATGGHEVSNYQQAIEQSLNRPTRTAVKPNVRNRPKKTATKKRR